MAEPERKHDNSVEATRDLEKESFSDELVELLDQYLQDLKAGKANREALLAAHPHLAEQLRACLAGIEFIHGSGTEQVEAQAQTLGDFRILREVGRGGMGAVYEAEQMSLGRQVALKVLRLAGVSDPKAMERFQREAETVANLHHTNIVPIFSVGNEHGVNYYAMQFIEGRSLADVIRESKYPITPDTVAQWGLQAAEALAHAHQRQVIHRDVKPSNLLLDDENRIWLTDFGLAKRLDDVTLSKTGALLGTPRYMSPEQATAATSRIDHRTDIYSLGATLYELATGQPVFSADTPHAVISQIINDAPAAPRTHRPTLPRDLETILMKCLDKDPAQRYASAGELASDLRAFLEQRPIAARRDNAVQRTVKWVRRHQRSVQIGGTAVAATLLLVLGTALGWQWWKAATVANITLSSNAPPLIVEVLDEAGERVTSPVTVPTQQGIEVPSGNLKFKASSSGRFAQTYHTYLGRGSDWKTEIDVMDQVIADLGDVTSYGTVEFEDGTDCFLTTEKGIRRVDGRSGAVMWDVDLLAESNHPAAGNLGRFIRSYEQEPVSRRGQDSWNVSPGFVPHGIDLNDDEHADVICYLRHEAILLALSGKDGTVLWKVTDDEYADRPRNKMAIHGTVIGEPQVVDDLDDDGTKDLVATFVMDINTSTERRIGHHNAFVRRWIDVISGRSGQSIWRHYLDDAWFLTPKGKEVPYAYRWHCDDSFYADIFHPMSADGNERLVRSHRPWSPRKGEYTYAPSTARVIDIPQTVNGSLTPRKCVVSLAGQTIALFDLKSGEPMGTSAKLDALPASPVQWRDVDNDGVVELIVLEQRALPPAVPGTTPLDPAPVIRVVVWSIVDQKVLWQRDLKAYLPHQPQFDMGRPDWPVVADLNHDGRMEMLLPNETTALPADGQNWHVRVRLPAGELQAVDAATGDPLWTKRIPNMDQQLDRFVVGPDINQDGHDEVFVGSLHALRRKPHHVYVDCLSGKDATTLWRNRCELYRKTQWSFGVSGMTWRRAGGDWPELVVQTTPRNGFPRNNAATVVFDPSSGNVITTARDIVDVRVADVDADGVDELVSQWVSAASKTNQDNMALSVLAGTRGERWRHLGGGQYFPAADFDNDGLRDLTVTTRHGVTALSSRSGRVLWGPNGYSLYVSWKNWLDDYALGKRAGDLNGDGTTDQLMFLYGNHMAVSDYSPLYAISGRNGRALWTADIDVRTVAQVVAADIQDLDGDGQPEVVFVAAMDWGYDRAEAPANDEIYGGQLWVAVLSGQSGRVQWKQPLSAAYGSDMPAGKTPISFKSVRFDLEYVDLSGDNVLDFVIPAEGAGGLLEHRALNGRDGTTLWKRAIPPDGHLQFRLANVSPVSIEDIDADDKPEVIAVEFPAVKSEDGESRTVHVVALDSSSGELLWDWKSETTLAWGRHNGMTRNMPARVRPFVIRSNDERFICVKTQRSSSQRSILAILDGRGQLVHEVDGKGSELAEFHAWPCDVDGDDQDEILVYDVREGFRMVHPAKEWRILWSEKREGVRLVDVMEIADGRDGVPGMIFLRQRKPDGVSVVALNAKTGRDRWICQGPRTGFLGMLNFQRYLLLGTETDQTDPHGVFMYNAVRTCRRAARVGEDIKAKMPAETVSLHSVGFDPRLYRSLPWASLELDEATNPRVLLWASYFSMSFIVLPLAAVGWIIWRRQFSVKFLLLLPVVVVLFLFAWRMGPASGFLDENAERFGAALLMVPAILCAAVLVRWGVLGQFRRIRNWLLVAIACTIAVVVFCFLDTRLPFASGERYLWDGWYLVLLPGLYLAACVLVGGLLLFQVGKFIYRKFHWSRA